MSSPRRRQAALLAAIAALLGCVACTSGGSTVDPVASTPPASRSAAPQTTTPSTTTPTTTTPSTTAPSTTASAKPAATLPRGGRTVFPHYRLVGYAGLTGVSGLGRLGTGNLDQRVEEMISRAKPYASDGRTILPVMEVITTVVQGSAGKDGKYRTRISDKEIGRYLAAARRHKAVLLLAIQPGRADFLSEVKAYDRWLKEPDVGVALDPEWAMGKGQVPGRVFGHTTGGELDQVSRHLADVVKANDLPEKIMVFHELAPFIVTKESSLKQHTGVAVVKSVDGIGNEPNKKATYQAVNKDTPSFVKPGFKLFYEEDRRGGSKLMTPAAVMKLKPRPAYVLYE